MSRLRETLHVGPAKAGTQVLGVEPHATPVVPDPSSIFPPNAATYYLRLSGEGRNLGVGLGSPRMRASMASRNRPLHTVVSAFAGKTVRGLVKQARETRLYDPN